MKIIPDKNGIYHGAYVRDVSFRRTDVEEYERSSGQKLDISGKSMDFCWGLKFPTEMAEIMSKNGGALLIKFETGKAYPLDDILNGKADHLLRQFAQGAKAFGKPVFVSIDHEMNGNWFPWGGNPGKYIAAYRYIHDKIEAYGANNITWVWNPNLGYSFDRYYPGDSYVDWVALSGYCSTDWSKWVSFKDSFSFWLDEISNYGKPIMIAEFGCDANDSNEADIKKPRWIRDAIDAIAGDKRINAFVYFNISRIEAGEDRQWALSGRSLKAYRQAMKRHDELFRNGILVGDRIESQARTNTVKAGNISAAARSNRNAVYITDSDGKFYGWNGGNAVYKDGTWRFFAIESSYPGFHIDNPGGNKPIELSGKKYLKFGIKGLYEASYEDSSSPILFESPPERSSFEVQVFEGDDMTKFPISSFDNKDFKEFSFDLGGQKKITKILFIMVTGSGSCDIQIKDFRIE
jgi:hypothetical protein